MGCASSKPPAQPVVEPPKEVGKPSEPETNLEVRQALTKAAEARIEAIRQANEKYRYDVNEIDKRYNAAVKAAQCGNKMATSARISLENAEAALEAARNAHPGYEEVSRTIKHLQNTTSLGDADWLKKRIEKELEPIDADPTVRPFADAVKAAKDALDAAMAAYIRGVLEAK